MPIELTEALVKRELGSSTFEKGSDLWLLDKVRHVDVAANSDKLSISGSVAGSRPQPYSQSIRISLTAGRPRITGYCSCPLRTNCKHVAAVLLHYIEDLEVRKIEAAPAARNPIAPAPAKPPFANPADGPLQARTSLSPKVADWLGRLTAAAAPAAAPSIALSAARNTQNKQLVYLLDPIDTPLTIGAMPRIRTVIVRILKDGRLTEDRPYDPVNITRSKEQIARFIEPVDMLALRDLLWIKQNNYAVGHDIPLGPDTTSRRLLETLLSTGRLRHGSVEGPVLSVGPPRAAEPQWRASTDGTQRLMLAPARMLSVEKGHNGFEFQPAPEQFDALLTLDPPHYVDFAAGHVGPIETQLPAALALEIARAPTIAATEAAHVKEVIRQRLKSPSPSPSSSPHPEEAAPAASALTLLPLPEAPDNVEYRVIAPQLRLTLLIADAKLKSTHHWYASDPRHHGRFPLALARLSFAYGEEIVDLQTQAEQIEHTDNGRLIVTPRDHRAEVAAHDRLAKLGLRALTGLPFDVGREHARDFFLMPPQKAGTGAPTTFELMATFDQPDRFIAFSAETVPALVAEGWHVLYSDDYPYRLAEGEVGWWADTGEGSGIDWFSFELGVEYDGHRINLVPQLAEMLARLPPDLIALATGTSAPDGKASGKGDAFVKACTKLRLYHALPDGRLLPLPGARMAPILKALIELIGPRGERIENGRVKLHRAEAASLAQFAGDAGAEVAWAASSQRLIELGQNLKRGRSLTPVTPPKSFKAKLRDYQADGLSWIEFLRSSGFGGVLADDMGLGKTIQALAFLTREKAEGRLDKPALIIAPTSVLPNWQAEAEKFAPGLSVLPLRGLERRQLFGQIPKHDIVLTTYPLLARDHEILLAQQFHIAILDEAQAIKNPKATITGFAHRINARHRLALTGTPLENNLGEVWSLFEFLSPSLLGDESTFRRTFRTPIEKHGCPQAQAFLSRRLKPFMLRRTKAEVAPELPPKTEIICKVQLEGGQRDLYETVRSLMHAKVRDEIAKKGIAKSHIIFLDALLKLRQICCDPRLLKMAQAKKVKGSAKLDRLMEMIPQLVGEGRRILLFSQFTSMLDLIEAELDKLSIPFVTITGDTTDRATPVKDFQAGKVPLFLLSLKAGGTGLNLTAADTVIHYDPWWNPAVEAQATDRAYRIGQDKPVFVYKMIVEAGIEEAIEQLKMRKAALADALFAGSSKTPLDLSEADISALFAPLDRAPPKKMAA